MLVRAVANLRWSFCTTAQSLIGTTLKKIMISDCSNESLATEVASLRARIAELEEQLNNARTLKNASNLHQPEKAERTPHGVVSKNSVHVYDPAPCVAMAATRVVMHEIVPPSETDALGICFGGQVLSWIDICAGLCAKTLARGPCVTASVDAVHFLRPCRLGMVVIIAAMVNRTFSSSMEVGVRVEAEDMRTGIRHHCCSAYLTFVAVKAKAQAESLSLPRVVPHNAKERLIHGAAEGRRSERLKRRQEKLADPVKQKERVMCRLQPITHREGCPTLPPALTLKPGAVPPLEGSERTAVSPEMTIAYMTQSIMPQHANTLGILFGGQVMRWMEQCAYISASRLRCPHLLMASMDSLTFKRPANIGNIMYLTAMVTAVFGSSLEVMISVFGEDPQKGEVFHCADAFATLVSVDEEGGKVPIPFVLQPNTPAEMLRYQGAVRRREDRLAMRSVLGELELKRASMDGSYPEAPKTCG